MPKPHHACTLKIKILTENIKHMRFIFFFLNSKNYSIPNLILKNFKLAIHTKLNTQIFGQNDPGKTSKGKPVIQRDFIFQTNFTNFKQQYLSPFSSSKNMPKSL